MTMNYDLLLTLKQAAALLDWVDPNGADVALAEGSGFPNYANPIDGSVYVGQGDARCIITPSGNVTEID